MGLHAARNTDPEAEMELLRMAEDLVAAYQEQIAEKPVAGVSPNPPLRIAGAGRGCQTVYGYVGECWSCLHAPSSSCT